MNRLWVKLPKTTLFEKEEKTLVFTIDRVNYPFEEPKHKVLWVEPILREMFIKKEYINRKFTRSTEELLYERDVVLSVFYREEITLTFYEGIVKK